ncbi:hypothetical protein C5B91_06500 [Haloferax sp. Atlit-10N]|uniref:Uncharacterized protein n=1 Tax=Haloferax prahovense (strain DSM 18310 / JCM 13924 / TL6) TaxID=1227461 RepID=M0GHY1_HALPT|nr:MULTISPECIES: hypothetical protein [Haloferax]ELZ70444.1 hypothetical protein C457_08334 [Haloferax prahovense DSM 18310]RDZ45417.1 hypothetical protein C5B86_06610 [Haloferax sp. Atlit-19N]RDZ47308.1 hypothetical protein C5B87_06495 [Haloferax sp. Atlit-16N]RDZ61142.1 hypothetical protein C5B91_06500 [Haloferax sp. Atlit-10N]
MTDDPDADPEADDPADSTPPSDDATESTDGDEPVDADATVEAADGGTDERDNGNGDETVPHVELDLYELSVRVSGQSNDELDDVEASATRLMDYLVDHAKELEDQPDSRGLS